VLKASTRFVFVVLRQKKGQQAHPQQTVGIVDGDGAAEDSLPHWLAAIGCSIRNFGELRLTQRAKNFRVTGDLAVLNGEVTAQCGFVVLLTRNEPPVAKCSCYGIGQSAKGTWRPRCIIESTRSGGRLRHHYTITSCDGIRKRVWRRKVHGLVNEAISSITDAPPPDRLTELPSRNRCCQRGSRWQRWRLY